PRRHRHRPQPRSDRRGAARRRRRPRSPAIPRRRSSPHRPLEHARMTATTTTAPPTAAPVPIGAPPPQPLPRGNPLVTFGRMVKLSHTVFALPFALAAAAIAARGVGLPLWRLAAIVVAMAGARTAAMGFNRI